MSSEDDMSEGEEEMKMEREVLMQGCIFSYFNKGRTQDNFLRLSTLKWDGGCGLGI